MQILLAVVEDLYTFAVSMMFPSRGGYTKVERQLSAPISKAVSPFRAPVGIDVYQEFVDDEISDDPEDIDIYENATGTEEYISQDTDYVPIVDEATFAISFDEAVLPQKHTVVYCTQANVLLRTTPDSTADTAIGSVGYGDMVMILEAGAEYSYVAIGNKRGYVSTSALAQEGARVFPLFAVGVENGATASNTVRVRHVICDEFGAGFTQLALQSHEYVYYKLLRRGTHVLWPDIRPRTAGSWARIF